MADSWQQIDDDGVIMDWDALALPDLWHPLEALRRAINERQKVLGITHTAPVTRLSAVYQTCLALHNAITYMLPGFVNHTDHSGDWDGQTTIPYWSEATMLTAIGSASMLAPARFFDINQWLSQSYKMLNLMRWVFSAANPDSMEKSNNANATTPEDIIPALMAAYNSSDWSTYITIGAPYLGARIRIYRGASNDYAGTITNIRLRFNCSTYSDADTQSSMDAYAIGLANQGPYWINDTYGNFNPHLPTGRGTARPIESIYCLYRCCWVSLAACRQDRKNQSPHFF